MLGEGRGGEMVDALALGASGGNPVEVQVLSPAPSNNPIIWFTRPSSPTIAGSGEEGLFVHK